MPAAKIITPGMKYTLLTIESEVMPRTNPRRFNCVCVCGKRTVVTRNNLSREHTRSCGCLQASSRKYGAIVHGHSIRNADGAPTSTYTCWASMLQRCRDPKASSYKYYGARGIRVCRRWQKFENFLSDMGEKPEGLSIDRISNDLGYFKGNCRWQSRLEQSNNRRCNVRLVLEGKSLTVTQWSRQKNISASAIYLRLKRGWSAEKTLTTPLRRVKCG